MKIVVKLWSVIMFCIGICACSDDKMDEVRFSIDETNVNLSSGQEGSRDILMMTNTNEVMAMVADDCKEWLDAVATRRCLTLTYKKNSTGANRQGSVTLHIGNREVQVTVSMPPYFEHEGGTYEVGDVYFEDGKAVGVVFWVDKTDRTIAKAVSLDRLDGAWSTEGTAFIGAYSKVDGQANTDVIRNSTEGQGGNIPALKFCDDHGEGWYWPAVNELVELFNAYNGTPEGGKPSTEAGGTEQEKIARAKFDKIFTDWGGTALDLSTSGNGQSYWASTEDNSSPSYANIGCNVRFRKFTVNMGPGACKKTGTNRFIRCVKAIGDYKPEPEPIEVIITLDKKSVTLEKCEKDSEQSVTVTLVNGTLTSATPYDNTWCSAEVQGNTILIKALSENTGTKERSTEVTVKVQGADGKEYTDKIIVSQKAAEAGVPGVEYKVGDYYEEGDTKGVIFWVSDDGLTAKIVSLTRSETTLAWSTEAKAYGVTDKDDGAANTKKLMEANDGNVPALALCKDGWYWPAINELQTLFEAYNGTTFEMSSNQQPNNITAEEKASRVAFDEMLTRYGGTKLNMAADNDNGERYWASTELDADYGWYIRMGKPTVGSDAKKTGTTTRYIRCIKQIGAGAGSPQ